MVARRRGASRPPRRATGGTLRAVSGDKASQAPVDVFARIVCGVDTSDAAKAALDQALRLATPTSKVVAVSVGETQLAVHAGILAPQAEEEIEGDARAALEYADARAVATKLVHGRADEMLLAVAADDDATLVAVGSHEVGRSRGLFLGSVATRLVHDAPCSVLVARATDEPARFPRAIVVGVDGSASSAAAATVAAELGARLGADVSALAAGAAAMDLDERELASSALPLERSGERPVPALVEASDAADLLIVGSRGLRGVRALGSVSERVAHHARCSLLVVRTPD